MSLSLIFSKTVDKHHLTRILFKSTDHRCSAAPGGIIDVHGSVIKSHSSFVCSWASIESFFYAQGPVVSRRPIASLSRWMEWIDSAVKMSAEADKERRECATGWRESPSVSSEHDLSVDWLMMLLVVIRKLIKTTRVMTFIWITAGWNLFGCSFRAKLEKV